MEEANDIQQNYYSNLKLYTSITMYSIYYFIEMIWKFLVGCFSGCFFPSICYFIEMIWKILVGCFFCCVFPIKIIWKNIEDILDCCCIIGGLFVILIGICFVLAIIIGPIVGFTYWAGVWPKCKESPCNNNGVIIFPDKMLNEHVPETIGTYDAFSITNGKTSYIKKNASQTPQTLYLYSNGHGLWTVSDVLGEDNGYIYNPTCTCSQPFQCASKWRVCYDGKCNCDNGFALTDCSFDYAGEKYILSWS